MTKKIGKLQIENMLITSKVKSRSGSFYIKIPILIARELKLKGEESIDIQIKSINQQPIKDTIHFKCLECGNVFMSLANEPYCEVCGEEDNLEDFDDE